MQLINILFCGYQRRSDIHQKCVPKPILARGTGAPASKKSNKTYMVESNFQTVSVEKCSITKQETFVSGRLAIRRTAVPENVRQLSGRF
jgi:hypothetical protein